MANPSSRQSIAEDPNRDTALFEGVPTLHRRRGPEGSSCTPGASCRRKGRPPARRTGLRRPGRARHDRVNLRFGDTPGGFQEGWVDEARVRHSSGVGIGSDWRKCRVRSTRELGNIIRRGLLSLLCSAATPARGQGQEGLLRRRLRQPRRRCRSPPACRGCGRERRHREGASGHRDRPDPGPEPRVRLDRQRRHADYHRPSRHPWRVWRHGRRVLAGGPG